MISSQFTYAVKETAETETKQRQAKDGHNDDDVVGRHDFFLHHLEMDHIGNTNHIWLSVNAVYLAMFLIVTEFAIDAAVAAQRTVDADSVFAVKLGGDAFGCS